MCRMCRISASGSCRGLSVGQDRLILTRLRSGDRKLQTLSFISSSIRVCGLLLLRSSRTLRTGLTRFL